MCTLWQFYQLGWRSPRLGTWAGPELNRHLAQRPHHTTPTFNDKDRNPPFYNILIIKISINLNDTQRVVNNNDDKDDKGLVFGVMSLLPSESLKYFPKKSSYCMKIFFFYFYTTDLKNSKYRHCSKRIVRAMWTSCDDFDLIIVALWSFEL